MVRRVAVLSDVHGVLPVLAAVPAEPGYPDRQEWADHLRSAASDAEALTVFGPRDGRVPG
jgi:hypothetical protein